MNLPLARHSVFRYVGAKSKAPALHKPGGLFLTGRSLETTPSPRREGKRELVVKRRQKKRT